MGRLHYLKESDLSWRRVKKGNGFAVINGSGKSVSQGGKKRIEKLRIPPAWSEVIISADPFSHIQACGFDTRGRRQYIYHVDWVKKSQEKKFDQLVAFGERLPVLRRIVNGHLRDRALSKNRIIATVVWLLEHTFIRVGNKAYAKDNQSYGLTTMRSKHVDVKKNTVSFSFKGKSGVYHELDVSHPRVAATIRACIDLPGYEIFKYLDEDGEQRVIDSGEVNGYLQTHTGAEFSAKDFRTWGASVLAGDSLYQKGGGKSDKEIRDHILETIAEVASHLGNTKKVCRTYYIHPVVISSYDNGVLVPHFARSYGRKYPKRFGLSPEEYATWSLIRDS